MTDQNDDELVDKQLDQLAEQIEESSREVAEALVSKGATMPKRSYGSLKISPQRAAEDKKTLPETDEKVAVSPAKAAAATKKKAVAKSKKKKDRSLTLANGIRVKLHPVAANVMIDAQGRIPDPEMRTFIDPTTGKDEPNPGSPKYIQELTEVTRLRAQASMDALLLFGLELLDPIPEENDWLDKLKFMRFITDDEHRTAIGEDSFLRELYYKKYMVMDANTLSEIMSLAGVTPEMVAQARKSFPGDQSRSTD